MKKKIKNLHKKVVGGVTTESEFYPAQATLNVIITNDQRGKTLSIGNGSVQFTIPFEPIERYLK